MFENTLLESTTAVSAQNRWPAVISFGAQSLLVVALLAVPMFRPASILARSFPMELAPPVPVVPPPMPRIHITETPIPATNAVTAPALQPAALPHFAQPNTGPAPMISSIDLTGGNANTAPLPIGNGTSSSPSISVASGGPSRGNASTGPHAISTGVSQGLLLTEIRPVYPPIAIAAHQQGIVTVEAVISTSGRVESAHATSGPAMLQGSAVEAVRNARYRPFQLNGQPTEVAATFSIHFNLGSQ
jgi:protein TonB